MEYESELYAERMRRLAQSEALASGQAHWTDDLNSVVRTKLAFAWQDAIESMWDDERPSVIHSVKGRTVRSLGRTLDPDKIKQTNSTSGVFIYDSSDVLSLLEAEHEALKQLAASKKGGEMALRGAVRVSAKTPTTHRSLMRFKRRSTKFSQHISSDFICTQTVA